VKTRAEKCAKEARISALFYGKEKCFEKKEENYEKKSITYSGGNAGNRSYGHRHAI